MLAGEVEAGFGETDVFDNQAHYQVHALEGGVLWKELPEFRTRPRSLRRPRCATSATCWFAHWRPRPALPLPAQPDSWPAYSAAWTKALGEHADVEEARGQWQFYQDYHPYAEQLQLSETQVAYMQDLNVQMGLQQDVLAYDRITDMSLAADALRMVEATA